MRTKPGGDPIEPFVVERRPRPTHDRHFLAAELRKETVVVDRLLKSRRQPLANVVVPAAHRPLDTKRQQRHGDDGGENDVASERAIERSERRVE